MKVRQWMRKAVYAGVLVPVPVYPVYAAGPSTPWGEPDDTPVPVPVPDGDGEDDNDDDDDEEGAHAAVGR